MQKGDKEVLMLRKPPDNAVVKTYKPDIKVKDEDGANADKKIKTEATAKQIRGTNDKRAGAAETKTNNANQANSSLHEIVSMLDSSELYLRMLHVL